MSSFDKSITTFHGSSDDYVETLVNGHVDISLGGGELGQGFYLGTTLHVAKAWAKQMHDCEAVVEFQINDDDFWNFDIKCLNRLEAIEHRQIIKDQKKTRTYQFYKDIIWSPIVGGPNVYSDQHKWESLKGQIFLNSNKVLRRKR